MSKRFDQVPKMITQFLSDGALREAQQIATMFEARLGKSRCARPGEPYRNRNHRCRHGFLGGVNCQECRGWKKHRVTGPALQERNRLRRLAVLGQRRDGNSVASDIANRLELHPCAIGGIIRSLMKAGLMEKAPTARITAAGLAALEKTL